MFLLDQILAVFPTEIIYLSFMLNIHKIIVFLHQIPSLYCYILTIGMSRHPDRIRFFHWDALCPNRISETMVKHHWDGHP